MLRLNIAKIINGMLGRFGFELKRKRDACAYLKKKGISPRLIVDVGANIGDTIHVFREAFPSARIIGFEPFSEFFQKCSRRFEGDAAVELFPLALSDQASQRDMYTENYNCSMQSPLNNNERPLDASHPKVSVTTVTLDQFSQEHFAGQAIDLLKIDVEGHEKFALKGAEALLSGGRVKAVLIEAMFFPHFDGAWLEHDIASFLSPFGFVLHQLFDTKLTSEAQMRYANALFIRQEKAEQLSEA